MSNFGDVINALDAFYRVHSVALAHGDDDQAGELVGQASAALQEAIELPARSLSEVEAKIAAILAFAEGGLIEADQIGFILRDVRELAR